MRALAVILLGLALAGCLRVEQEIVLEADNTGQLRLALRLPTAVYREFLADAQDGVAEHYAQFLDPDRGSRWFAAVEGLELQRYRVYEQGDMTHLRVVAELTDARAALASGRLGRFRLEQEGDRRVLRLDWPAGMNDGDAEARRALMAGAHLELRLEVPGEIVSTSATEKQGRRATWIFDTARQKDVFDAPPEITVVYR